MRALIRNKLSLLLKACIFSGLALICLTAFADGFEEDEYAGVPPGGCHYAEHPIIRETVYHKYTYRHVTHHHYRAHRRYLSPNGLVVYYPFTPSLDSGGMWPSDDCPCNRGSGYVLAPLSSDGLMYSLMYGGPIDESDTPLETTCD